MEHGAHVKAHDPAGMETAGPMLPGLELVDNAYAAAEDADALVLLTEWNQYRALDLARLKCLMKSPVFVDLRNVYDPAQMKSAGFHYTCIGR